MSKNEEHCFVSARKRQHGLLVVPRTNSFAIIRDLDSVELIIEVCIDVV